MPEIATPQQLQTEIRRVLAQVTDGCSRRKIAVLLEGLANRVVAAVDEPAPPKDALADIEKAVADLKKAAKGDQTANNIYECLGWLALGVQKISRDHVPAAIIIQHAADDFHQALMKIKPRA
jgi:hypothetical protein